MKRSQWLPILERFTHEVEDCNWRIVHMNREEGLPLSEGRLMRPRKVRAGSDKSKSGAVGMSPIADESRPHLFIYPRYPRDTVVVSDGHGCHGSHGGERFEAELLDVSNEDCLLFFWREVHKHYDDATRRPTSESEIECAGTIAWEDVYRIEYKATVGTRSI